MNRLLQVITSEEDSIRNQSLDSFCESAILDELFEHIQALDGFWRTSSNLYHRVRALFYLSSIYQFHLPRHLTADHSGLIPYQSYCHLLERRFKESIDGLMAIQESSGASLGLASALSHAYKELAFQTLADQVRKSVRSVKGNQWMFRVGHPADHPLRFRRELVHRKNGSTCFPILCEKTSVRMDFSHSGWSDIFFLGMDFPKGAKVINASVDLGVHGRDDKPRPPIECYLRVIDEPLLRLNSTDLKAHADVSTIADVFDFAQDYLGLLKAAVIAGGIIPPGMEGCDESIEDVFSRIIGPGLGLEIVSKVNNIPKGSRLAVSTNLLGSLISICMRATGQVPALTGGLEEPDRRIIAARAILGEWIGGSGGGWQDSGGIWPGIKLICGSEAKDGDPEYRISRGRLLPNHHVFADQEISPQTLAKLQDSLVLVHGGMAQNVGPILEMVTEKYLLRSPREWQSRMEAVNILEEITSALQAGDIRKIGAATHRNFFGPLQNIIPWCTNLFTNLVVEQAQKKFADRFWGFWMLGGMAGGGMGFIFHPDVKSEAQVWLQQVLTETKRQLQSSLPFAMEPVVYDFSINHQGSWAEMLPDATSQLPHEYYSITVPRWLKSEPHELSSSNRSELQQLGNLYRTNCDADLFRPLIQSIFPEPLSVTENSDTLNTLLAEYGFDRVQHEQIQADLRSGRYGLSQNRLATNTKIEDVGLGHIRDVRPGLDPSQRNIGNNAIRDGQVAIMTLAAGVGSRWTEGAGVVKGLHPYCQFAGKHRTFLETHLAKSRHVGREAGNYLPHIITTGYLTHEPIESHLQNVNHYEYPGIVTLSPGKSVGLRMVPMVRDLQFEWEETAQQQLDEQQEKMRTSMRSALMNWAHSLGQGTDYTDNMPLQCMHPVGHWYEIPNLLRNGALLKLLEHSPNLKYIMLHNIDTLGASVDPAILGLHIESGKCLSFEVIERRLDDRGGGLALVNGNLRLLEGLAMPREEDEFKLSYYNSMTTWIDLDKLLSVFRLARKDLDKQDRVDEAVRQLSQRMPTYITIKDVKKRWGNGQEDIFPVSQFEKLWSDMTALPEVDCGFFVVPWFRGQQLKHPAQLDGWLRDGSAAYVDSLCRWE